MNRMNTIEEAIEDFREGKFLIVVDDEDRENEGDFIIAAEKITQFYADERSGRTLCTDYGRTVRRIGAEHAGDS